MRQADLEQRAGCLVVGRIAVEQRLELLLCQREVLGDVETLAKPVQGIRRVGAIGIALQEILELPRRVGVVPGLERVECRRVAAAFVGVLGQRAGVAVHGRFALGGLARVLRRGRRRDRGGRRHRGRGTPFQPVQAAVEV